jgi:ketosteroid isomerase-like protein
MKTLLIMLSTLITSLSFGQSKLVSTEAKAKAEKEILTIENKLEELEQKNDRKAIADYFEKNSTENFTVIFVNGDVIDRATVYQQITNERDPKDDYETFKFEDKKVEVYGDAAVFTAKTVERTKAAATVGKAPREVRFSHFFVKQNGAWKLARHHNFSVQNNQNVQQAQQEILALEDKWVENIKSNDNNAIANITEKITADNFTHVNFEGDILDKATTLKNLRSSTEKKEPWETLKQEERKVEIYGDAAVYSAKVLSRTQEEAKAGKSPKASRLSRFYVKQDGIWKMVRYQFTSIPIK